MKKENVILITLFLVMAGFKIFAVFQSKHFNSRDDTAMFWTESALQYANARQVAQQGFLPVRDERAQFPEGLDIKNRLTVLMEVVCGFIYRIFIPKTVPFHIFLIIFISLYSSMSIVPLYHTINLVTERKEAGFLGTAFYVVTPAVYLTVTHQCFELQDFTLPLIFAHLYFFTRAIKTSNNTIYAYSFISASFLFAAFASWHMTQFYHVLLVLFVLVGFFFLKDFNLTPFYFLTGAGILAGIIIPAIRNTGFLFSLSMLLSYSILIPQLFPKKSKTLRRLLVLCLLLMAIGINIYISFISIPEYRFVYGLLWDKMRYFGIRPADPVALPWETLVMWVSPFTSPSLSTALKSFGTLLGLGIAGVLITLRTLLKNRINSANVLFLFFTVVFFILYLLFIRLDIFLAWFLCFLVGGLVKRRNRIVWLVLVGCIGINSVLLVRKPSGYAGPDRNYLLGLLKYIRYNIPQDSPVLTNFAYAPSILAYTRHPILLHPKFEAKNITKKIKEFEHSLFGPETSFYSFCSKYKAMYFVYQTDMLLARGPETIRYRTHNLKVSRDCIAFKLHFRPDELRSFELVYSNPHYRVFRILDKNEIFEKKSKVYYRVYDETLFNLEDFGIY